MVPSPRPPSFGGDTVSSNIETNDGQATLRQRKVPVNTAVAESISSVGDERSSKNTDNIGQGGDEGDEEVTWGKTPSGVVFRVPQTSSFLHTMLTTAHRSSLTRLTLVSLFAQPVLFYLLRDHHTLRSVFFLLYFAFWRGCYDWGFAWVLRKQSEKKWVVRQLKGRGWLDANSDQGGEEGRQWAKWWKGELEMKMGKGYKWEDVPAEFNAWLMFRQLVDVVLLNDFVSYTCFAWANLNFPANHSVGFHVFRWIFGGSLILFNLWVKMDAHRVVKDYAWYWGDAFWLMVMQHDLVFDGVYEIAPHPMYSVGYAGYYGLSMVVGSYTVLFVSLAAHAAQFAFLLWFENPHIERTYGGGKKPLVSRVPLTFERSQSENAGESGFSTVIEEHAEGPTPSVTEGETETEAELPELPPTATSHPVIRKPRSDSIMSAVSGTSESASYSKGAARKTYTRRASRTLSMHDLTHRFFRKPVIVLERLDLYRAPDFALVVLVTYALSTLIPPVSPRLALAGHFVHALVWRLFHSFGLGLLLRAQSKTKWLVRHYLKHYHYPGDGTFDEEDEGEAKESVVKRATEEAFGNWQVGYNISLVMTYVSFAGLAWKTYHLPMDWTVSGTILRHVLGFSLIALHIWSAVSSYEVLGDFGWLYSDFFLIEQIPSQLAYTGIYRFLNNPEQSMGGAAFFGLWLISNSKLVFALALASHLSHWWFLSFVERPHMQKLYGDRLRKDGGLTKTLKNVAARPMFSEMVHDTKILLQHSRERMIITRVASDISAYDQSRYSIALATSSTSPNPRYHVGQPIRVSWSAPSNHSRKDWIGIYRLGSCKSQLVTRISSVGKWMPIYEEEWDGDEPVSTEPKDREEKGDVGEVVFKGEQLPWLPGQYELRYHHDGKHNVMSRVAPIEIYVAKPDQPDSIRSIRSTLLNIVCLSLDSDPSLIPRSAKRRSTSGPAPLSAMTSNEGSFASAKALRSISEDEEHDMTTGGMGGRKQKLFAEQREDVDGDKDDDSTPGAKSPASFPINIEPGTTRVPPDIFGGETTDLLSSISPSSSQLYMHSPGLEGVGGEEEDGVDADDFVIMTENQAKRIASLAEMAFGVEVSPDVVVADANVGSLARRVVGARSLVGGKEGGAVKAG
ncbi:hypothetical protein IAR55_004172 [Kwoniella newhampshirensis]|uniref:Phosphatidylethanolamine N-methyltransferase n=1 Tax=Kwoniella newhampshirensis TaxID=1651941 RepID=A0AAW0YWG6_9TREE